MTSGNLTDASGELSPVTGSERIQALDVVRGFALIGIFLMNVEFFNRPLSELGQGLPASLTGADWLAGWLIYNFVQGKFWTMFSLLFGMGFAVMLTRAERSERNFMRPYLRRIAALAVFGIVHHIFIWGGDILFSYAVAAAGLLILLYGNWKYISLALLVLLGFGFLPGLDPLWQVAGGLAVVSVAALFLRSELQATFFGRRLPLFSVVFLLVGAAFTVSASAAWLLPGAPSQPRVPMTIMAVASVLIGVLSARFHDPVEPRAWRLAVAMYLFPFLLMTTFGASQYFSPATPRAAQASAAEAARTVEHRAERDKGRKEHEQEIAGEARVLTNGSYLDSVRLRGADFAENAAGQGGFAPILIGMFLLGAWFVRSGVMENTAAHLPLFRRLALCGLPVGIGLGLLGSAIATARTPWLEHDPYQMATGLTMIGNLPACLAYVSLIVLMLHGNPVLARIRVLAPLGRMALTNYLTQSLVGTLFFYGYGLGYWGMGRAMQVLFVAMVIALQIAFCHWWLARFRYGPMEWLWRSFTYWRWPPMRCAASPMAEGRQVSA